MSCPHVACTECCMCPLEGRQVVPRSGSRLRFLTQKQGSPQNPSLRFLTVGVLNARHRLYSICEEHDMHICECLFCFLFIVQPFAGLSLLSFASAMPCVAEERHEWPRAAGSATGLPRCVPSAAQKSVESLKSCMLEIGGRDWPNSPTNRSAGARVCPLLAPNSLAAAFARPSLLSVLRPCAVEPQRTR